MNESVLNPYEINEIIKRRKRMTVVKKLMTSSPLSWAAYAGRKS
jgi:hypothetical protein